jgi:hypothetical protein
MSVLSKSGGEMPSMKSSRLAHLSGNTWNRSFNIVVAGENSRQALVAGILFLPAPSVRLISALPATGFECEQGSIGGRCSGRRRRQTRAGVDENHKAVALIHRLNLFPSFCGRTLRMQGHREALGANKWYLESLGVSSRCSRSA